ncbi:BatA domain-containing protein [Aurantibacter sp.]|uniref:BatA domain-containing protein n=1 Tax=Aurantibacter sp. TaxID=2807103 RepID=UPI003263E475
MQFRHPELLWALLLLLIPIFIHLFQLRRFKKTPFTNVALLQKVISNSRRSSTLKKWLLLFTRMFLLAGIVIAFAQPFFAEKNALKDKETTIYIDNSFSMQAKAGNATLLQNAIQEVIQNVPKTSPFNLFTNSIEFRNSTINEIQNELLSLEFTNKQLSFEEIQLKGATFFSKKNDTRKEFIYISDFQNSLGNIKLDSTINTENHFVQLLPDNATNITIDSVYISKENAQGIEVEVLVSGITENKNIPISLYNEEQLIAKSSVEIDTTNKGIVNFSIQYNEALNGRLQVSDNGLNYDNTLYFNINKKEKIKTLAISDAAAEVSFLNRIFTKEEFTFNSYTPKTLNYSDIASQNLIILNELKSISTALQTSLKTFKSNGGTLLIIPAIAIEIDSYNQLLLGLSNSSFQQTVTNAINITDINFSNPLFKNVFEKEVVNFQYPSVKNYNRIKTTALHILSFQDKSPFLIGTDGLYLFTASLSKENSNFKNSPLIVPTLYNIGLKSLKSAQLYNIIGNASAIDLPLKLAKDDILKMKRDTYEFIPQQQSFNNKVSLKFIENPAEAGIYSVLDNQKIYQNLSFNYSRAESNLMYTDFSDKNETSKSSTISNLFDTLQKDSSITELWKWFIIFALIFLLFEIFIQKFFS